jgi:hypothetical protein
MKRPNRDDLLLSQEDINKVVAQAQPPAPAGQPAAPVSKIVDIITFCESPTFLNLPQQDPPTPLWQMQRIILKLIYRGSKGNESVRLTQEELNYLNDMAKHEDLDYLNELGGFQQVIEKYNRGAIFKIIELVMGRRSSKTFITSIMATYEAYKLLELPNGNPQRYYKIVAGKEIYILGIAVSEKQALELLFKDIKDRVAGAPYFRDKINKNVNRQNEIRLLTEEDKRVNAERASKGINILLEGSIVLLSGHSNSPALRGKPIIFLAFDEIAHFPATNGKSSGDSLYYALVPSVKQFGVDGKIVMLSDPSGKEGVFWKTFELSQSRIETSPGKYEYPFDDVLAIQCPTWRINPDPEFSKENLERTVKPMNPAKYFTTYAARFMGAGGTRMFDPVKIEACVDLKMSEARHGDPHFPYYIHLDPASTSHNYALALVHAVPYTNNIGEIRRKVFLDCVRVWTPTTAPVNVRDVENEIRSLCRKFSVRSVTFDSFQSQATIQNLRASGINAFETPYRNSFINKIYGELKNLINQEDLVMYPHQQMVGELKNLLYKITNFGFKRFFDANSDFPADDCCDALAGACFQALSKEVSLTLPRSALVYLGMR